MDDLLRYVAITEEIRRLEAERDGLKSRALRQIRNSGGSVEDGAVRIVYVAKPVYRFSGAVENMRLQLARRQRREIERGIAKRTHDAEVIHIERLPG
ncbi:MAG: hypothetical protein J0M02_04705 [Planctomycetes bacterium]|nr:hypothetical protein [Planctomycetota bacterium]